MSSKEDNEGVFELIELDRKVLYEKYKMELFESIKNRLNNKTICPRYLSSKSSLDLTKVYRINLGDCNISYFANGEPIKVEIFHSKNERKGILTTLTKEDKEFNKIVPAIENYISR